MRLAFVVLFACAALLLTRGELQSPKPDSLVETAPVVVATRDIPAGAVIGYQSLTVAQWPVGTQPAGAYTSVESIAGRRTRVAVYQGEPIVPARLAPAGFGAELELSLTPGKRAYSIRVDDAAGLVAMIQPNSRVDIMLVIADGGDARGPVAKLFMSNVRVLAIDRLSNRRSGGPPVDVTVASVEVSPEDAERLAIASAQGQIQLVLRGDGDAGASR